MNAGSGQGGAHGPSSLHNWWPADPRHTSSSTSDVMSQLCRVCGEPAAGFHFGAFTCEGCKSFFGRTYNNLSSISECKNNGECVINKKNRTSCKACRLRKCLVVGMSKSGSRYGRRSNWFKIHCLLQEQQQQHNQHQQQSHAHPQHLQLQPIGDVAGPLGLHFQSQHQQQQHRQPPAVTVVDRPSLHDPGRTSPTPLSWADVKHHHMRLDADNNNSVAGDLNKDGGLRLSVSAAAAAAAVHAVRPEMLRWPSPFFPGFPFPPPMPFFLAMQTPAPTSLLPPPPSQSSSHYHHGSRYSPSSRSSSVEDDAVPSPPKRVAIDRDMPPVQDSPMDLSVTAAAQLQSPRAPHSATSRSPSPSDAGSECRDSDDDDHRRSSADGSRSTTAADLSRRHHRRRQRGRRRLRHGDNTVDRDRTSGSESESSSSSGSPTISANREGRRPVKNSPLDLTCNRS